MSGKMLRSHVEDRQDGVTDGIGDAAPGRVFDRFCQVADLPDQILRAPITHITGGQLLELLAHHVHTDAARPAAATGLFLNKPDIPQCQIHQADVTVHDHAPPADHGFDAGHVGLLEAGQHFGGFWAPVPIGESR